MASNDEIYKPSKHYRDKSLEFAEKHPHHHLTFFNRPDFTRRKFFRLAAAGLGGSYLMGHALTGKAGAAELSTQAGVVTKNTAKNLVFIQLTGAISPWDTFDLKTAAGTSTKLSPTMVNGVNWPMGIFPKLGTHLSEMALVRSMSAWALVHSLGQTWSQIGRNPAAALGDIAPNIASVVAIEKEPERKPGQIFPTFVALNTPAGVGPGYFPAAYAPFRVNDGTRSTGIPDTSNANGQPAFNSMFSRLHQYDDGNRVHSPYGSQVDDYDTFYTAAKNMMYNPAVTAAFGFAAADGLRYGAPDQNGQPASTPFGNALLVAKQILAADQGTRAIQIQYGSWDMHQDIYGLQNANGQNMFTMGPVLDGALSSFLADMKASGLLDKTLIVMSGEFGRTPGISAAGGRDHFLLQSAVFAGAGIKGGKVLGATNADGSVTTDFGWNGSGSAGPRYVRPEDIEATIYSALGIDWTTIRRDDPFGRGFEYVPFAYQGTYGPINELWG